MMNLSLQLEVEEKIHEKISFSQKLDIMKMYLYLMHFRSSLYIQIQDFTLLQGHHQQSHVPSTVKLLSIN